MNDLAVYVHIPFCTVKCGYCDFNAYAGMEGLKSEYRQALLAEVEAYRELLGGSRVTSLAFGGGTPGEVPARDSLSVIDAVRTHAGEFAAGAEVSLEANPGTTTQEQLRELCRGGVTRISFGAQSFDAMELKFLDRIHSPEAIAAAVVGARTAGFGLIGLDLIYGLPGQGVNGWLDSIRAALALKPEHLSLYCLTVEEGTPLGLKVARGQVLVPDPDHAADQYHAARALLRERGYEHYEISNWALPGHASRHNQAYWTGRDYLGLGAGAHGYLDGTRYENIAHPRTYIAAATTRASVVADSYTPERTMAMTDWLVTGLRRLAGIDASAFEARFAVALESKAPQTLADSLAAGVLERTTSGLRLTESGLLLHGEVSARLSAELNAEQKRGALQVTSPA